REGGGEEAGQGRGFAAELMAPDGSALATTGVLRQSAPAMTRPFAPVVAPPLSEQQGQSFPRAVELVQRLLAPDGCPWDREQTLETLRRFVLEEACEVIDAIEDGDRKELCAELGDLLFQVVFQAELARAEGSFGPDDVIAAICDKLVRRHPHVFEGTTLS